jgi:hypothetical protein
VREVQGFKISDTMREIVHPGLSQLERLQFFYSYDPHRFVVADVILLNSPGKADISHILEKDPIVAVQEAGYHGGAGRAM